MRLTSFRARTASRSLTVLLITLAVAGCAPPPEPPVYDLVLRGGTIYDGRGGAPFVGDVAMDGERIAALGDLGAARGRREIDVGGLAVSPGFINMLSWAGEYLPLDGRGMSDILQGVTLEVFGEGLSLGPVNEAVRQTLVLRQDPEQPIDITWTTLGEHLDHLVERGVSPNVASFVGATTVRLYAMGYDDRAPTPEELAEMEDLVRQAMAEGALGVGSALFYTPGLYASTEELIALARAAGESGGLYISHVRSEGRDVLEAVDELITIAREAGVSAEIYHLKVSGKDHWDKLDPVIAKIEAARAEGLQVTADVYPYLATSSALHTTLPPWAKEGPFEDWLVRFRDPEQRRRILAEMRSPNAAWEGNLHRVGSAEGVLLGYFKKPELRTMSGRTLADVARERGTSPEETILDLMTEDEALVGAIFFTMSEDNLRRKLRLPWASFGSDSGAAPAEGVFLEDPIHPRTYGTFARMLGHYVRDLGLVPLEEAIRRMTSLPATNLGLRDRGLLEVGFKADLVVFDPATIGAPATYEDPHHYATGVRWVLVNGTLVVEDGEHTGAMPGQVVRGPGWTG